MKIADKKIEYYEVGRLFFDVYRHHRSIQKAPSTPYVAFLAGLTPFMYLLTGILHDP